MKIKNFELLNIINILGSFGEKKLPQKISYAIIRNNMLLSKELECYNTSLKKIMDNYNEHMLKDDDGNFKLYPTGIPMVRKEYEKSYDEEITELLNIEIDVSPHIIDEKYFDYDDSNDKYDVLSPVEIIQLQQILCRSDN